ncbi:MAG: hypothetical protein HFI88_01040 [Lachnospiraceae bacterium]|nr:hypothetical protein [Lachnospiraceae bacterium]
MKKKHVKTMCGLLTAAVCLAGCGNKALDGTQTVLTVNGTQVSLGTAMFNLRYQQSEMQSYSTMMYSMYGMEMGALWDEPVGSSSEASEASEASETSAASETSETSEAGEASGASKTSEAGEASSSSEAKKNQTYGEQFKDTCMDGLADMLLLQEHMEEFSVVFSEEDQAAADQAAEAFVKANDEELLQQNGITAANVAEYLKLYTIQQRMHDPMVADVDKEVSDEEAAQSKITYVRLATSETDEDAVKEEKKAHAEEILSAIQGQADVASADMEALATPIDENAYTTDYTYGADDGSLAEAVRTAADTLNDGELYGSVVEADGVYYIVRMDAKLDRESTDQEKENIISEREDELYQEKLDGWNDAADVTVNEKLWNKVKVTDSYIYTVKQAESEADEVSEASEAGAAASEASEAGSAAGEVSETSETGSVADGSDADTGSAAPDAAGGSTAE